MKDVLFCHLNLKKEGGGIFVIEVMTVVISGSCLPLALEKEVRFKVSLVAFAVLH